MTSLFAICLEKKRIVLRKFSLTDSATQSVFWLFTNQRTTFFDQHSGDVHEYNGRYTPDPKELLFVSNVDEINELSEIFDKSAVDFEVIEPTSMHGYNIKALMIESDGELLIQQFSKAQYLSKKRTIIPRALDKKTVFDEIDKDGVVLGNKLCAVLQDGKLLFHREYYVRGFIGLTKIFREATENEIKGFFSNKIFEDADVNNLSESTSSLNRKKIFSILESGQLDRGDATSRIKQAAIDAQFQINWNNDKIIVPKNRRQLSTLLSILDDKIARGLFSQQLHYVNSSRPFK